MESLLKLWFSKSTERKIHFSYECELLSDCAHKSFFTVVFSKLTLERGGKIVYGEEGNFTKQRDVLKANPSAVSCTIIIDLWLLPLLLVQRTLLDCSAHHDVIVRIKGKCNVWHYGWSKRSIVMYGFIYIFLFLPHAALALSVRHAKQHFRAARHLLKCTFLHLFY